MLNVFPNTNCIILLSTTNNIRNIELAKKKKVMQKIVYGTGVVDIWPLRESRYVDGKGWNNNYYGNN